MWTHHDVLSALNIQERAQDLTFSEVSIDTRTLQSGDIFIALPGSERDPSFYTEEAIRQGATFCILPEEAKKIHLTIPHLYVPSTLESLRELGRYARQKAQGTQVVAVTGSAGKTTVKSWLAQVLEHFGTTKSSRLSYNNHIGAPLSLTQLIDQPRYGIFEAGMNHAGEIEPLAKLINPHIAVITSIGAAHIGHIGSIDAICKEKASIVNGLYPNGLAIAPYNEQLLKYCTQAPRLVTFGSDQRADVQLLFYTENQNGSEIEVSIFGDKRKYQLGFKGLHLATNILIILAVLHELKLNDTQIENLLPLSGRGNLEWWDTESGFSVQVMNDTYNANPLSMEAGLKSWATYPNSGRRIAILGEMKELGDFSVEAHDNLKHVLESLKIDFLYTVGEAFSSLSSTWKKTPVIHAEQVEGIIEDLRKDLRPNDFLFIKGSNGSRVHQIRKLLNYSISPKN